jgi:Fe-Mn family superoxide dismutase
MEHKLPPLPFAMDALEPHMSRETLEYHYGKHHKTYVEKLNQLIKDTEHENEDLEHIVKTAKGAIFNNAAQAWNHTFFWHCLTPERGLKPRDDLSRAIDASFGSMDAFKDKFTKTAVELFGSGWTWLVCDASGKLSIEPGSNAATPIAKDKTPVLTCDVWEHAYYIDYRNARPDFLKAFWNLANWDFAGSNFEAARKHGARSRSGAHV